MSSGSIRNPGVYQVAKHRRAVVRPQQGGVELYATRGRLHQGRLLAYVARPERIDPSEQLSFITSAAWEHLRLVHGLDGGARAYIRITPKGGNGWVIRVAGLGHRLRSQVELLDAPTTRAGWMTAIEVACRMAQTQLLDRGSGHFASRRTRVRDALHTAQIELLRQTR